MMQPLPLPLTNPAILLFEDPPAGIVQLHNLVIQASPYRRRQILSWTDHELKQAVSPMLQCFSDQELKPRLTRLRQAWSMEELYPAQSLPQQQQQQQQYRNDGASCCDAIVLEDSSDDDLIVAQMARALPSISSSSKKSSDGPTSATAPAPSLALAPAPAPALAPAPAPALPRDRSAMKPAAGATSTSNAAKKSVTTTSSKRSPTTISSCKAWLRSPPVSSNSNSNSSTSSSSAPHFSSPEASPTGGGENEVVWNDGKDPPSTTHVIHTKQQHAPVVRRHKRHQLELPVKPRRNSPRRSRARRPDYKDDDIRTHKQQLEDETDSPTTTPDPEEEPIKRKRGRPKKIQPTEGPKSHHPKQHNFKKLTLSSKTSTPKPTLSKKVSCAVKEENKSIKQILSTAQFETHPVFVALHEEVVDANMEQRRVILRMTSKQVKDAYPGIAEVFARVSHQNFGDRWCTVRTKWRKLYWTAGSITTTRGRSTSPKEADQKESKQSKTNPIDRPRVSTIEEDDVLMAWAREEIDMEDRAPVLSPVSRRRTMPHRVSLSSSSTSSASDSSPDSTIPDGEVDEDTIISATSATTATTLLSLSLSSSSPSSASRRPSRTVKCKSVASTTKKRKVKTAASAATARAAKTRIAAATKKKKKTKTAAEKREDKVVTYHLGKQEDRNRRVLLLNRLMQDMDLEKEVLPVVQERFQACSDSQKCHWTRCLAQLSPSQQ